MIYNLSNPQDKSSLATTEAFKNAFRDAIAEVSEEIVSQSYNPYQGFIAETKMLSKAQLIYSKGLPKVDYGLCRLFLSKFSSGSVDDESLNINPTFTIIVNKVREWFELYSGVTQQDKTTPQQ